MKARRPQLLLRDPNARSRLRLLDALRSHFEVYALDGDEDIVRVARQRRPAVVVLAMPRARLLEATRTCRALKTNAGSPAPVALIDRWGRLEDPVASLDGCDGDGYLAGNLPPEALVAFVEAVLRGERPVTRGEVEKGLIAKVLGR